MNKKYLMLIIILGLIILSACGSDSGKPTLSLRIEMTEFKFNPTSMSVYANREISLTLVNNGAVEHEFTILKQGAVASIPFDRDKQAGDILVEYKLGAGQTGNYTFTLPTQGEYNVICAIQGHMESGMVAKIEAVNP